MGTANRRSKACGDGGGGDVMGLIIMIITIAIWAVIIMIFGINMPRNRCISH